VRIDEPGEARLAARAHAGFLAGERRRQDGLQVLAQPLLDLAVHFAMALVAARSRRAVEFLHQVLGLLLHGSDDLV
jgi:hypothetical protein